MIGRQGLRCAPYLPLKTFLTALDYLYRNPINPIHRDAFPHRSNVVKGQILGALRFFGLIDDHGYRQPGLEELLDADRRQAKLRSLLESCYEFVAAELEGMTVDGLKDALSTYNVNGETAEKAKAFFLASAKFAGLKLPPQLSNPKPRSLPKVQAKPKQPLSLRDLDPKPNDEPPHKSPYTIELSNDCRVTLVIEADWRRLAPQNRKYMFSLIDAFNSPVNTPPSVRKKKTKDDGSGELEFDR